MNKRSFLSMTIRLFKIAKEVKSKLIISTLASIIGNLSHLGLMGFGSLFLLSSASYINISNPYIFALLMGICAFLIIICRFLEGMVSHEAAYTLLANMRVHMFNVVKELAPARLMDRQKGDILSIALSDIETIEFFFAHTIGPIFTVILLPLITLILAGNIHIYFISVLLPLYIIISIILPYISLKLGANAGAQYRKQVGLLKSSILESIYSLRDIQIFNIGKKRQEEVLTITKSINKTSHILVHHRHLVTSLPTFFIYLARILIIYVASILTTTTEVNFVSVIVLSYVVSASFSSTMSLTMVVSSLLETYGAANRLFDLEDLEPEVKECDNPIELEYIDTIEFKDVSFTYPNTSIQLLDNLNLKIKDCDQIGIQGPSGTGKSTIIRLLLRFYNPTSGQILINGIDIQKYSLYSLRKHICLLEQETYLFNDIIAFNIAFAKPDATMEEIQLAAKRAGIAELIDSLPERYNTKMGELEGRLSGGEKQRIGIARVLLVSPDVLVMDEPTSSLDVLNEKGLLKTLKDEYSSKKTLIVSHRPSTLTNCTQIYELKNGQLL